MWYPGRSVRYALKGVTIAQSNAERTEVSRGHSSREVKDRISRSLEYDRERRSDRFMAENTKAVAVRKEIVRNMKGMRKRQGHSIGYGKKETVHSRNSMEAILYKDNLNRAYKRVKANKGAAGTDGMSIEETLPYLKEHQQELNKPDTQRKIYSISGKAG